MPYAEETFFLLGSTDLKQRLGNRSPRRRQAASRFLRRQVFHMRRHDACLRHGVAGILPSTVTTSTEGTKVAHRLVRVMWVTGANA